LFFSIKQRISFLFFLLEFPVTLLLLRFKPSETLVLVDTGVEIVSKDSMFHRSL
jgi:hypothetical protein